MIKDVIYVLLGMGLLYGGAEFLVRSCITCALRLRIPPLIIALTVVAFVTSLPEAVTSGLAQVKHIPDIALGNILGSNIANIGLVFGIAFLICPTKVTPTLRKQEIPIMLGVVFFLWGLMALGPIGWIKGVVCMVLLTAYTIYQFTQKHEVKLIEEGKSLFSSLVFLVIGIAMLIVGAEGLVTGGTGIAQAIGISDRVIAITLIALGTSLPELATSIIASYHRHTDIVMGNIIGSNIFNSLLITAFAAFIAPIEFSSKMTMIDAPVMCGFALVLFLFSRFRTMGRMTGFLLLTGYVCYIFYLI